METNPNDRCRDATSVPNPIGVSKFYDLPEEDMEVLLMRCYKLNDVQGIPYIANAGDKIVFDHRDTQQRSPEIRVNGELRNDLKDLALHRSVTTPVRTP